MFHTDLTCLQIETKRKGKYMNYETNHEIEPTKNTHGGWRGGLKPRADYTTKMFRADVRLSGIIETLKTKLKAKQISETDLKAIEELII
jgi:hypothetical protein